MIGCNSDCWRANLRHLAFDLHSCGYAPPRRTHGWCFWTSLPGYHHKPSISSEQSLKYYTIIICLNLGDNTTHKWTKTWWKVIGAFLALWQHSSTWRIFGFCLRGKYCQTVRVPHGPPIFSLQFVLNIQKLSNVSVVDTGLYHQVLWHSQISAAEDLMGPIQNSLEDCQLCRWVFGNISIYNKEAFTYLGLCVSDVHGTFVFQGYPIVLNISYILIVHVI